MKQKRQLNSLNTEASHVASSVGLRAPRSGMIALRYRVGQLLRGFVAQIGDAEWELVTELLPQDAAQLFAQMPVDVQRHSLNVLYDVQAAGVHDADLAAAALLHDVGKARSHAKRGQATVLGLWWRGPLVLLEHFAPHWLLRWASPNRAHGVRSLVYLHVHHPRLGAAAARAAGCSEITCRLIAHHQDKHLPHDKPYVRAPRFLELLHILQWADSRN